MSGLVISAALSTLKTLLASLKMNDGLSAALA